LSDPAIKGRIEHLLTRASKLYPQIRGVRDGYWRSGWRFRIAWGRLPAAVARHSTGRLARAH